MTFRVRSGKKGLELRLHELEAAIMDIVWTKRLSGFAVSEVVAVLEKQRDIAYTTVMTTLARLHEKGLLARERDGKRWNTWLWLPLEHRRGRCEREQPCGRSLQCDRDRFQPVQCGHPLPDR